MDEIKNIAVYIDFENFPDSSQFEASKLISKLKERGRIILKKAYADWGRFASSKRQMLENSIELIEMPSHGSKGKNSSDIKLVVEALETALTKNHINTFVVIAGDSDYTPLISKLRELNKYVIVIGHRKTMSELLKGYCDEIYFYDNFIGLQTEKEVKVSITKLTPTYSLLTRAIYNLQEQGQKCYGSRVKQHMRQLDSSFDEYDLGFKTLKNFWVKSANDKIIKFQPTDNGDYIIEPFSLDSPPSNIKVETNEKLSNTKNIEFLDGLIYWATRLAIEISEIEFVEISDVAKTIREIDDTFSLQKYNYTATSGFKKIVSDYANKNIIEYKTEKINNNTKYLIKLKANEIDFMKFKPSNYNSILDKGKLSKETTAFKKLLREEGYSFYIDNIKHIANQINSLFNEEKSYSFDDIVNVSFQTIKDISEETVRSNLNTLLDSGCFVGIQQKPIYSKTDNKIIDVISNQQIEINVLDFIEKKLVKYDDDKPIEPRILKFIVYAEI